MSLQEECGVFGLISPESADLAGVVYYGLYALQHRGQESCGIVVNDDGVFSSHKDLGLVSEVFSPDALSRLPKGKMAVGHVRYGTTGGNNRNNCQPIEVNHQKGKMALAPFFVSWRNSGNSRASQAGRDSPGRTSCRHSGRPLLRMKPATLEHQHWPARSISS